MAAHAEERLASKSALAFVSELIDYEASTGSRFKL
jgi:hypothetical protein